jgi:hypothetical protein
MHDPKARAQKFRLWLAHLPARLLRTKKRQLKQVEIYIEEAGLLNQRLFLANQRRNPGTGDRNQPLGVVSADDGIFRKWKENGELWSMLQKEVTKQVWINITENRGIKVLYPEAAQKVFTKLCEEQPDWEIKAVVFGHTHLPHAARLSYNEGPVEKKGLYLNAGDWYEAGEEWKELDRHHANFIVFGPDGEIEGPDGKPVKLPDSDEDLEGLTGTLVRDWIKEKGPS